MKLPEDTFLLILAYLSNADLWNAINVSPEWAQLFGMSYSLTLRFCLEIDPEKYQILSLGGELSKVPFRNVSIKSFDKIKNEIGRFSRAISAFKCYIEKLEVYNIHTESFDVIYEFFKGFLNLKNLKLVNCTLGDINGVSLDPMPKLETVTFDKCDGNIFKLFHYQVSITKLIVINTDWTWNGFDHDDFNDMAKTLPELDHLVMEGTGTGSYFENDNFPYRVRKLEATLITFDWYVGIKTQRVNFFISHLGYLKELIIHKLPYDFDGGRVLKFIMDNMNLEKFYFGKTPLLLNGEKQQVKEIMATEVQISSAFQLFREFGTIESFTLFLTDTDIDSGEIERIINPRVNLFSSVKNFEVIDRSGMRGLFGVFLPLFKNMINITKLSFKTPERNINVILEECLPYMTQLNEIYIDSKAPREAERYHAIRTFAASIKKLSIAAEFVEGARAFFDAEVEIVGIVENETQT